MRKVTITYRMTNETGETESAITLPMADDRAKFLLIVQHRDGALSAGGTLDVLLAKAAHLQGHRYTGFVCARPAD